MDTVLITALAVTISAQLAGLAALALRLRTVRALAARLASAELFELSLQLATGRKRECDV